MKLDSLSFGGTIKSAVEAIHKTRLCGEYFENNRHYVNIVTKVVGKCTNITSRKIETRSYFGMYKVIITFYSGSDYFVIESVFDIPYRDGHIQNDEETREELLEEAKVLAHELEHVIARLNRKK